MLAEAADLRVIERRIGATSEVRKVVHAIWALARAQLPLVEQAVGEASAYLDWVDQVVDRIAGAPQPSREKTKTLYVVLGPERPYCGGLPRQILEQLPSEGQLGLVGQRLSEMAELDASIRARTSFRLAGAVAHDEAEEVARRVATAVLEHAGGADVEVLHPRSGSSKLHAAVLLGGTRKPVPNPPDTFSPLEVILDAAVVEAITGRLAVGALEALFAEVRARIAAADSARRACDDKLEELGRALRVVRQEQTTSEMLEVVAGRQAVVEGGGRRS